MKRALLAGAAALAVVSTPAFAETAPNAAADTAPSTGEIVVTAQHVKSLLSRTPIAMSAVSGDSLRSAGVNGPAAIKDVAPGISIDHTDGLQITIRGVTSTDQTEKGDPSAAFMLDGVYIARTQAADVSFYDIDRVEVLRGPQGTLYGRNTTAGVVNVITNRPKLGVTEGAINASVGNYAAYNADAMVNLPLGQIAALRVAGSYDRHDNYVKPSAGDTAQVGPQRENATMRGQLLIEPSSDLTILLRGDYASIKGSQMANFDQVPVSNFYSVVPGTATTAAVPTWLGNSTTAELIRGSTVAVEPGILGNNNGTKLGTNEKAWSTEGEVNYTLGPVTLTDLASYRHFSRADTATYSLGAPFDFPGSFNGKYSQFSNEFRVATNGSGPLKLQAGAYYFHEHEDIALYLFGLLNPTPGAQGYVYGFPQTPVINRTIGTFAQGTYTVVPHVRLTAGVRYTSDYKYRYGHTVILPSITAPLSASAGYVNDASIRSKKVTWRAGIDADVPTGLAYATVSTGYKAGGFGDGCSTGGAGQSLTTSEGERCDYSTLTNPALPLQTNKKLPNYNPLKYGDVSAIYYQPETLTAYEIGYKGRFADGAVRVNAAAFYYNYTNMQLSGVVSVDGAPSTVTTNAGKASVKGLELETVLTPAVNNRVTLGLDLLDAHYSSYCAASDTSVPAPYPCIDNWNGKKLDHSPSQTVRAAYNLTIPTGDGKIDANIGTRFMASYVVTAFYALPVQYTVPSHTTTDATLTYTAPNARWMVQAYVKNIENFISVNGVNTFGFVTALGDPRTFGLRAGVKF